MIELVLRARLWHFKSIAGVVKGPCVGNWSIVFVSGND